MAVAEALLDGSLPPVDALAALLQEWLVENGRGAGRTTTEAIGFLQAGAGPIEAGLLAYAAERREPNGGLMRSPPIAIARRVSPRLLIRDSAALCAVTHYGALCEWSCCVVIAVIAQLLAGTTPDLSRLASAVVADRGPLDVAESIATVTRGASPRALNAASEHRGHTLLTMQMGLWAALTPLSFEDALVKVVSAGGDTDTNGAVAGAVLGARYGAAAIPARWLVGVPQLDTVAELAHALFDLAAIARRVTGQEIPYVSQDPVAALLDHLGGVDGALPVALRQETRTAITELTLVLRAQGAQPDPDPWPAALRKPLLAWWRRGLYTVVPVETDLSAFVRAGDAGGVPHRLTTTSPAADPPRAADMPARGC